MSISQPIFTKKKINGYMEQRYTHSTRWEKNIVVFLYVYCALAIFLLFWNYQDTESESQEMVMVRAGTILTQIKKGAIGQLYSYYTRWVSTIVVILHIYGPRAIFILFCNYQDTEFESGEMKSVAAATIFTKKIYNAQWDSFINTPQYDK